VAVRFAAEGADVAITGRTESGLAETAAAVEALGRKCLVLPGDLADVPYAMSLAPRTEAELGPIDLLVNNAVAFESKPVETFGLAELEEIGRINLWIPWQLMARVIPGMRARGRGSILNLTSLSAELPPGPPFARKAKDGSALHGATKAALNRLTLAAAGELEGSGVSCNALTPQIAILTPRVARGNRVPFPELMEPLEAMAEAALALCTGDPNVLTGRIAYSLQLLLELERPVRDLHGEELVEGWQVPDLPGHIRIRERFNAEGGWPNSFEFHRCHTPYPAAMGVQEELR
jgi:NAD(P)-dependent dehydrogenase (short-subunit alcohol dehydrogenase family)